MGTFRYSLNGSTIRPTPILDKIRIASAAGFEGIELWHDDIDAYLADGGTLAELGQALGDHGLSVPTTIYLGDWFDADDAAWPSVRDECQRRLAQAATLGAPHVIAGPPLGQADVQHGAKRYRELLEIGETMGVLPSMEFLGFVEQLNTIEAALEVMEQSGHPKATTILDPFHIQRGGGTVESIAKLTGTQVATAHFMDTLAEPSRELQHDEHRAMPGDGCFDLKRYLELLTQIGFNGWLSLELFREDLWERDPNAVAREGLAKMKALIENQENTDSNHRTVDKQT